METCLRTLTTYIFLQERNVYFLFFLQKQNNVHLFKLIEYIIQHH